MNTTHSQSHGLQITLCFSTFPCQWESASEDGRRSGGIDFSSTTVSKPAMAFSNVTAHQRAKLGANQNKSNSVSSRDQQAAMTNNFEDGDIPLFRECLHSAGLPADATNIVMQSWRPATEKQYGSYIKRWVQFCDKEQICPINPSLGEIMKFLTPLYKQEHRMQVPTLSCSCI